MKWEDLTKAQRWAIADKIAEERLPEVNKNSMPVVPSNTFYVKYIKRIIDIVVSGIALIVTSPFNLIAAIITYFDVGSPLFFKQTRIGKNGKPFTITKFRNMTNDVDKNGELLPPTQRVTKFGKFMRKTSFDELLNFWSVFKGDMSLIGPRPLVPEYTHRYSDRHKARLLVRPGLECPPRSRSQSVRSWQEQFENDIWYVEHVSFKTDCKMIANLVRFALDSQNANARAATVRGSFIGYDMSGNAINAEGVEQKYIDEVARIQGSVE